LQSDLSGASGLALRSVRKSFGKTAVLHGVDLHVAPGQFLTLLGPSGCGKTTLLRIIAGLESADSGEVFLNGKDITETPANKRPVNTVFQSYALFGHMRVWDNIAFGLVARGVAKDAIKRKVDEAMELVQIGAFARRYPGELSGGQKQRVALARALVNEPQVLLLDEPMSALDARLRAQVQVELRRLQRKLGTTFILVTHDQDEAMAVSDWIVVMNAGRVEQEGHARAVFDQPRTRFVAEFVGGGTVNLIHGTRVGEFAVNTGWGELVCRPPADWAGGLVGIRPERVVVSRSVVASKGGPHPSPLPEGEGVRENQLQAVVKEVIQRAGHQEVYFEATQVSAVWGGFEGLNVGDRVTLTLPGEHLFFLGNDGGAG
jgi:spermidine/putrescine transport system ATP-binding protein